MPSHPAHPSAPVAQTCPRCAYDLSAIPPSWSNTCPLTGTCSECGYTYLWRDILRPEYTIPPHFYEYAQLNKLKALRITLLKSLRPWSFWRWVQLHHTPRRSLFFYLVFSLIMLAAAFIPLRLLALFITSYSLPTTTAPYRLFNHLWPAACDFPAIIDFENGYTPTIPWLFFFIWSLLLPLSYFTLPTTLRQAKVTPGHILRIATYAFSSTIAILTILALTNFIYTLTAVFTMFSNTPGFTSTALIENQNLTYSIYALVPVYITAWWGFANSRYLKINHPWLVSLMFNLMVSLASIIAFGITMALFDVDL